jgi:Uma2 family endonuclease
VHRFDRDEYHRMAELGLFEGRVELIEGEIIDMSPQKSRHATAVRYATRTLEGALGAGFEVRPQLPLTLGPRSEPEPDIAVVPGSAADYRDAHPTSALLLLEVADTTLSYDLNEKARLYASARIPEYWVVDLVNDRLIVHRSPAEGYSAVSSLGALDRVAPLCAPTVSFRVSDFLP